MIEDNNIDPKYRDNVYNALKLKVSGFDKSPEEFKEALKSKEYVKNVHNALKLKVSGFDKDLSTFESLVYENTIQKKNQIGNGSSTTKETPSVSSSKIQPVTSLDGEKTPTVKASATSTGVKITPFKGFSKDELTQMKKPESVIKQEEKQPLKSVKKAPLYAKQLKLQRELSTAVVTPENQDEIQQKTDELAKIKSESLKANKKEPDFVDSLVSNLDVGLFSISKAAVKDAPEFAFDLVTTIGAKAADVLGDDTLKAMTKYKSDDVAKILGFRNIPAEELQRQIDVANNKISEYNNNNGGDPLTAISNGNYLGASKMIAGSTVQSLPLVLAAMTTGGGALPTIFATSASMEYGELKKDSPQMSDEVKLGSAIGVGILEGYLGKLFSGASGLAVKRILADKGIEEGSKIVKKGIISSLSNVIGKSPIVGLVGEMGEEGSVEFGNQTIQILNGTRQDYDIKQIGNAAISSSGMGLTNTTAVYGAKGYMKASDYKKAKKVNQEIDRSISELSNPILTDADKQTLSNRIDRLSEENKNIVKQSLDNIKSLPTSVKNEVYDINNNLEDLKIRTLDIQDNSAMSQETKETLLSEIKREANDLVNRRSKIIDGTYIYDDFNKLSDAEKIDRKDKAGIELLNEAKAKGAEKASFDDAQITKKAVEDYGNERKQRSDREAANQEKPTGDQAVSEYTQPTGEGEKGVRSVQEKVEASKEEQVTKPTEAKGTPDVVSQPIDLTVPKVEIKDKSTDELEKRQAELDEKGFKSFTKESEEFGEIDKELERREWKSVLDSSLEDIPSIVDSLMKKEKEMPNGYGSYMEKKDARETKDVAEKYSKPVTKQESKKDFKDSFFGNPDTWYADGLKMRESVRSFLENGGTFKELLQSVQKEFESDGFSEQEAASVVKSKLDKIKKVNEPIDLGTPKVEVKPTEPTAAEAPIVETTKESKARQTLVDKTKNAEQELKDAWKNLGNLGAIYDPKVEAAKQVAMNKAIVKYVVNKIALSAYDVNTFVKDMASNGIELTKEGADFLFDKSQKAYKAQIEKLTGVSRKPPVGQARQQKVINKAYSVGVATQKIETEAQKQKAKEVKAEISDLKKQFNDVISAIKTEKDISKKEALQKQANKLNEKISDLREKSKLKVADLKEKARLEISDLKAQFNDIMSAIKTERDIVRKEALQKQADKLNDKIAGIKKRYEGKLTEAKSEIKELKDKVKDIFSASIEAVKQVKNRVDKNTKVRFEIGGAIKSLANRGKITQKQSADISKKLSELNVENEQDIRDFLDYVDDVFLKSDKYQKIADADKLSARLKSMSKDKTKSNKLTAIAKRLASIDTSKVKDIDKHIEVLNDALSGLKGTTIETKAGEKKIVGRAPMSVEDISNYMDEHDKYEFEESKKEYKKVFGYEADEDFDTSFIKQKISEMRSARSLYKKLTGEDAGGMTLDKISEKILEVSENESVEENFEKNYQEVAEAMLSESKRSAQEVLDTGVNPLTGEPLIQKEIDIVNSVINFSAKELTTKEMVNLINKLDNFTKNGVLGGLGDVASRINGNKMATKFKATGKTAKVFKRYFSPTLGNAIGRYLTNPRFIIDEIFLGRESGEKFWKASGIRGFQNGKAKAIKKASVVLAAFEKFNDNKSFMDIENVYERAMWAHISREVGNNLVEKEKNFAKVKDWMKQSYENLMNSKYSKDVKKGEYYKKVYDKILDGSNSIDEVGAKVNEANLQSVDVYKKAFSEEYSTTKFTMDAYFNKDFRQDDGYAMPVRFGNVDITKSTDVTDTYFGSNKKVTLRKKAGSMNEDKRSNDLGKKYIDLDFDRIAHQEFEKVCIANETIPFAVQYQTFKNTKDFGDIIEDDGTRDLIKTTLDNYIITSQGVNVDKFEREWQKLSKFLGAGSKLAVSQSLVGISQFAKQTVPMMPSTLINSGKFDFTLIGNKDFANFLANSGRSTAMRGLGSLISFDAAAEALKANKKGAIDSFFQYVSKKKDKAIEFTVKKPDVFIADISWGTYYQQKVGPVSDWSKHDIDTDAADYADSMVDADQGASDPDLVGEVFRKSGVSGGLLKMALPFARFAINTKANLHKNLVIAFSRQTSNQERVEAFRGISATMTQLIAFKALSQFIVFGITEAAKASFGEDDEDELNDGISQMMKDKETSQMYLELIGRPLIDAFSPVPATDELVAKLINYASGLINEDVPEGMRAELFESKNNTTWGSNLGLISISIDNILKAHKAAMTAKTGVIKGKGVQTVTAQDYASPLLGVLILSALTGIGLTELTSYARKSINMEAGSKGEIKRAVAKGTKFRNYVEEEKAKAKEEKKESVGKIKAFLRQYGL